MGLFDDLIPQQAPPEAEPPPEAALAQAAPAEAAPPATGMFADLIPPGPAPLAWSDVPGKALASAPGSAVEFAKNLVQPIIHPIETAKSLGSIAGGLAEKAPVGALAGAGPLGVAVPAISALSRLTGGNEPAAEAFGQFVKDRYGSVEAFKQTLAKDPVGAAADLSLLLTGGGGAAARLPGVVGRVGEVVGAAGRAVDPLRPVLRGVEAAGEALRPVTPWKREMGVRLSAGQRAPSAERLPLIQREQAALRGQSGAPAQQRAQEFFDTQRGQLAKTHDKLMQSLDPLHGAMPTPAAMVAGSKPKPLKGTVMAETPYEAGEIVSRGLQRNYDMRRKVVSDYYKDAERYGGEIHPDFFDDIGSRIKGDLSGRAAPVIVDDKLTPFANAALRDVEEQLATFRMGSGATGVPPRSAIVGVSLTGVNVMRQRLAAFRDSAFASGNAADGRATQAVLRAFEDEVHSAVRSAAFAGDPRAVKAWEAARAAHADVRATFGAGRRDPAGQNVEKILGQRGSAPATANDVIDMIMPASVNPSTTHVATANRLKRALGERSPEWGAVRQGVLSRLTETPPGVKDWGPGKVADRINKFLSGDGRELAEALFTPGQRTQMQRYADLHRKIEIPQAGANWSNTATFLQRTARGVKSWGMGALGAGAAHLLMPGAPLVAEALGFGLGKTVGAKWAQRGAEAAEKQAIAKQLPIVKRTRKTAFTRARPEIARRLSQPPAATLRGIGALGRYTSQDANPYQP